MLGDINLALWTRVICSPYHYGSMCHVVKALSLSQRRWQKHLFLRCVPSSMPSPTSEFLLGKAKLCHMKKTLNFVGWNLVCLGWLSILTRCTWCGISIERCQKRSRRRSIRGLYRNLFETPVIYDSLRNFGSTMTFYSGRISGSPGLPRLRPAGIKTTERLPRTAISVISGLKRGLKSAPMNLSVWISSGLLLSFSSSAVPSPSWRYSVSDYCIVPRFRKTHWGLKVNESVDSHSVCHADEIILMTKLWLE